jgi:hypothetical protein
MRRSKAGVVALPFAETGAEAGEESEAEGQALSGIRLV